MNFFTFFSLDDLTFLITAQKRFELFETENELIIYDELSFILYNIGNCGVSYSQITAQNHWPLLANASQNRLC